MALIPNTQIGALAGNDKGTNDVWTGSGVYYGDALTITGKARGGDDVLTGAADVVENQLFGDADEMHDKARGGNDVLISGTGTDYMWGEAYAISGLDVTTGTDIFVFKPASGDDLIYDFRQSDHDKIDVSGYGFDDISDLTITDLGSDTLIVFGGGNSVTLTGFVDSTLLTAADFIFA
jgi:Ca2+-binding RTX toxin-like protein